MRAARALQIALALLAVASVSAAVAHTGGTNGCADRYTASLIAVTPPGLSSEDRSPGSLPR